MLLIALLCLTVGSSRLVVDRERLESLKLETITEQAELINSTVTPHPPCPLIEERQDLYRLFLRDGEGREVEELVLVATKLDFTYDVDKIHSARLYFIFICQTVIPYQYIIICINYQYLFLVERRGLCSLP